jgi:cytochrome c553
MRRSGLVAAALSIVATLAVSAPSSKVAWTLETVRLVRSGNPAHGAELNKDCVDCHGKVGIVDTPDVPNLAGQDPLYTFKQLQDYKDELRASPIMGEVARTMSVWPRWATARGSSRPARSVTATAAQETPAPTECPTCEARNSTTCPTS